VLKRKYLSIAKPKKGVIYYATTNRQETVKFMASRGDLIIVISSHNSSHSNRLCEVEEKSWTMAYMVDPATQVDPAWLVGKMRIGVTAAASAPEVLVQMVIDRLRECGAKTVRTLEGVKERVTFPLPKRLGKL
jgi:4-hydroxy-3-methylbut-2-en-1-yl diphosphate reductase